MKNFKCPICYQDLIITGQARLETTVEHVENPNGIISMKDKYECINVNCPAFIEKICWDEGGEYYVYNFKSNPKFIDNNNAPFGSLERKLNVEIYKKDENYTLLNFYFFKIKVVFKYKSNENGTILERKGTFQILKRDKIGWVYWMSPWRMFFFHLTQFKLDIKQLEDKPSYQYLVELARRIRQEYFNDTDKRFYRKVAKVFINIFYQKIERKVNVISDYEMNRKLFTNE